MARLNIKSYSGFTLIELVIVVVILGILASVALPKFIGISGDAQRAATTSIAGALSSAAASNYGARSADTTLVGTTPVSGCTDVSALLGSFPSGYTIAAATISGASNGSTATCTLTGPPVGTSVVTATFQAIRIN